MQGATDSSGHPIDRDFYRTFWGLQAVFQQPYSIIEPSAWAAATGSINRVIAEFRKQVQRTSRLAVPSPSLRMEAHLRLHDTNTVQRTVVSHRSRHT